MDLTGFMSMPTDQAVAQLMQAYPNINPKPLVDSVAHLNTQSDSYIGAPSTGYEGSGMTPSGTIPGPMATPQQPFPAGLAGGSMPPRAPMPAGVHVTGVQPQPWTDPRTFQNPANQPIPARKRSGSLGEILGGLK